jgi:hypothetical protein
LEKRLGGGDCRADLAQEVGNGITLTFAKTAVGVVPQHDIHWRQLGGMAMHASAARARSRLTLWSLME